MASDPSSLETGRLVRKAVEVRGLALLSLAFQGLGIIYADIATSPLYTLNGLWPATGPLPSDEDIIGGVSAILWSLTLLPLIKYALISLYFGTGEGEGGTFALFQGLFPPRTYSLDMDRELLEGINDVPSSEASTLKLPDFLRWPLLVWCLFGTSLVMADGIFTPAVSVTSAVAGIAIAKPSVSNDLIPISIAFLVVLFLAQPFGTNKLAGAFSPVALVWLLLIAVTGIVNIVSYPGIFRALDPSRAIMLFVRTGDYDLLAGVILALTGCEALFANLGQFNRLSIQISFCGLVFPAISLAYLGQGARLIVDKENVIQNIFFQSIPGETGGALYWIVFVFGILATLIASQSLITACFSLAQQLVNSKSLPPIGLAYTSDSIQGQVYIPIVNWALMVATIVVVAAFKSSAALTNAFGFAVATVMFSTTILLAASMRYVKFWPVPVAIGYLVIFGFLDGVFWGASLKKVPNGAWVPLMIGVLLMILMWFWTWAKGLEDQFDDANRKELWHFIVPKEGDPGALVAVRTISASGAASDTDLAPVQDVDNALGYYYVASGGGEYSDTKERPGEEKRQLVRIPTCAVFHKMSIGHGVPHSFVGFVRRWPALPQIVIFMSVRLLPMARVPLEDRFDVSKLRLVDGFYSVTYNKGYREEFDLQVEELMQTICRLETALHPETSAETIDLITRCSSTFTHMVPHYVTSSRHIEARRLSFVLNWVRSTLITAVYRPMATMFPDTGNWLTPADEVMHVGINAVI